MNVVIIEDEKLTAKLLADLLLKYDNDIQILAELPSVEESVAWLSTNTQHLDLIFMDIHLEDGDSFQIFQKMDLKTPIIFTTAFDEYMIKAFKVNSIAYLLKPVNLEDLTAAIEKFKSLKAVLSPDENAAQSLDKLLASLGKSSHSEFKDRFMVTVGTKIRTVKTSEIAFFFLEDRAVMLSTFEGVVLPVDYSLDKIMQIVDYRQFFRINRQFIVSLNAIQLVHTYSAGKLKLELKPKPREDVFVSGDRMTAFKEWLGK